ncbi:hypothetical protein D1970_13725 [Mesobacillus zeae]|uniref:HNH endonuclease n=1 Tax=Mesobacillus zeae TaxID=1917180 RepID=A0A398B929_9BACI|nr:hypothetical protein D1970_13725 [Mesobacillus zeae]
MAIVPVDKWVKWNSKKEREKKKYKETYGDLKWNWKEFELHHVKPRQYGGNNDFSYLFPTTSMHRSVVSHWWAAY